MSCKRCELLIKATTLDEVDPVESRAAWRVARDVPGCESCIPSTPRCTSCHKRDHLPGLNLCDYCAQSWSLNL